MTTTAVEHRHGHASALTLSPGERLSRAMITATIEDPEWGAALYILTEPQLLYDDRIWRHAQVVTCLHDGPCESTGLFATLRIEGMAAQVGWSQAESTMVRAAGALFSGDTRCDLRELRRLDARNAQRVFAALDIAHGRLAPEDVPW